MATAKRTEAEDQAKQITQNAQREAETLIKEAKLEAKDLIFQAKTELEKEQKAKLAELAVTEKRLIQREIADKAAVLILDGAVSEDGAVRVDVADGELTVTAV